jgi:hypothetical protein
MKNEVYELEWSDNEVRWNRVEGDILPEWAQNREPDYLNLELAPTDRATGYNRFAVRVRQGYQAILRISASQADMWERVPPT